MLNPAMPRIKACYEVALAKNTALAGKLQFTWKIAADGRPYAIVVAQDTLGAPAVPTCITDVLAALQYPRPLGGGVVDVTYPFIFSSGERPTQESGCNSWWRSNRALRAPTRQSSSSSSTPPVTPSPSTTSLPMAW